MAEAGDLISEFKNAKPPEKMLFVGGAIVVVLIILYVHNQQSGGGQASQANLPSAGGTGSSGGGGGIQTVPTGQAGQVPLLPSGFVPIFDAAGNLIGYQPTQTTGGSPPPLPPSPTPSPKHGGHDKGSHGHNQSPSGAKHEQNLTRGGLRGEGRQDITQGRKDIRQAHHLTGRQTLSNKTNTVTAHGGNLSPASNAATRGGLVQRNTIPMGRPQRGNPTLQRSTVTRTAASTRLRG